MNPEDLVWSSRAQLMGVIIAVVFLMLVLSLVRKRRLLEEYSVLWLGLSVILIVLASWKTLLLRITRLCGASDSTSILFFFGMIFFLLLLLHFSVKVTKLTHQTRDMAQRMAITDIRFADGNNPNSPEPPMNRAGPGTPAGDPGEEK